MGVSKERSMKSLTKTKIRSVRVQATSFFTLLRQVFFFISTLPQPSRMFQRGSLVAHWLGRDDTVVLYAVCSVLSDRRLALPFSDQGK